MVFFLRGGMDGLSLVPPLAGVDLEVTTDFRQVLAEVLVARLASPHIDQVFPGFVGGQPLGVVRGPLAINEPPRRPAGRLAP